MRISRFRRPRSVTALIPGYRSDATVYGLLGAALLGAAVWFGLGSEVKRVGAAARSTVVTVNAASYDAAVAPGAIAAAFGAGLASGTDQAAGLPLPTELKGTSVSLVDSLGVEHDAPLFFVSAGQINYLIPESAALGAGRLMISDAQGIIAEGEVQIVSAAPALFTFSSNGRGAPVGLTTIDGVAFDSVVNPDGSPKPIYPGHAWQPSYLTLFGTGLRQASDVRVRIAGIEVEPFYSGPQGQFIGLDQINLALPQGLPGGPVDLILTAAGRASNHVQLELAGAAVPTQTALTASDVQTIVGQAVARAQALNVRATIAVLDHEGNVLNVFQMTGANPNIRVGLTNLQTGQILKPVDLEDGLEGLVAPIAFAGAISKAGTAAFLSTQGNAFSTRTASFIVQDHGPPLIRFSPAGPLFGVQFSQLRCSDVNARLPLGLAGDPGGVPIYKNGVAAGGIGVELDGLYSVDIDASDDDQSPEEIIAIAGTRGFESPANIRADQIYVDGVRLPFVNSGQSGGAAPAFNTLPGASLAAQTHCGAAVCGAAPTRFEPLTLGGVPGRIDRRFFPFRGSTRTGGPQLTAEDVNRIITQAAQQAYRTRAAIRRPLGSPAEVNFTVVDTDGTILGIFSTIDAPIFGFDVSAQKARASAYFSNAVAGQLLRTADGGKFAKFADAAAADGLSLAGQTAFSARGFGFLNRPYFPDGIDGTPNGPFSKPIGAWSPFNVGIQIALVRQRLLESALGQPTGARCTGLPGDHLRNGAQIFAGGVPLYKNGILVGAIGVSGDGIDQDDIICSTGSVGFEAASSIRTDQVFVRGVRLPYVKFPRHPNL